MRGHGRDLERVATPLLDKPGLHAFAISIRSKFDAASVNDYMRRRWCGIALDVRHRHHRKTEFFVRFERIAAGAAKSAKPTLLASQASVAVVRGRGRLLVVRALPSHQRRFGLHVSR